MANMSDVHGTILFDHPTAPPTLINDVVEYTHKNFEYGSLEVAPLDDSEALLWNHTYDLCSFGRWSFMATLSNYFESFSNAPQELRQAMDGLVIHVDYVDYDPGSDALGDMEVRITARLGRNGMLKTELKEIRDDSVDVTAEELMNREFAEFAFDSFTPFGINQTKICLVDNYKEGYLDDASDDLIALAKVLENNIDAISNDDLLAAFKRCSVYEQVFDSNEDVDGLIDLFDQHDVTDDPTVKAVIQKGVKP